MNIQFELVKSGDENSIGKIAGWYFSEWKIDPVKTVKKLSRLPGHGVPFQILMTVEKIPVATGGLYDHVGLLDVAPKFRIYGPWLALVFTTPENRNKGYGTLLCEEIQNRSKELGLKEIFLFAGAASSLYRRMGWVSIEERSIKGREAVVMKKDLRNPNP